MNLGRALAHSGKTDKEALIAFVNAERAAPAPFVLNPMARDAVVAMTYRAKRRAVSDDLRPWPADWAWRLADRRVRLNGSTVAS